MVCTASRTCGVLNSWLASCKCVYAAGSFAVSLQKTQQPKSQTPSRVWHSYVPGFKTDSWRKPVRGDDAWESTTLMVAVQSLERAHCSVRGLVEVWMDSSISTACHNCELPSSSAP